MLISRFTTRARAAASPTLRSPAMWAGAAAAVLAAAVLSGCAPSASSDHVAKIDSASEASSTLQGAQRTDTASETNGAGNDLTEITCSADANGSWSFAGQLTNSSSRVSTYRVTVEVARQSNGVVLGQRSMYFDLQPHESREVRFSDVARAKGSDLICAQMVTAQRQ